MKLSKEDKKRLFKRLEEKARGRDKTGYKELAKEFNMANPAHVHRYYKEVKHKVEIEKIKEHYDGIIRKLKSQITELDSQEKEVIQVLYNACLVDKDVQACHIWYRATGKLKKAEEKAKDYKEDEERLDWKTEIDKLWEKRNAKKEG